MKEKTKRLIRLVAMDGSLTPEVAKKIMMSCDDWEEQKHPRDKGGKFTSKGGGGGSGGGEEKKESGSSPVTNQKSGTKEKPKGTGRGNWGHGVRKNENNEAIGGSTKSGTGGLVSGNAGKSITGEVFSGKNYSLSARGLASKHKISKDRPGKTWVSKGKKSKAFPNGSGSTKISEADVRHGLHTINKYLDENGQLTPERAALHEKIIGDLFAGKKPVPAGQQKTFYFLGGGSASGKSSFTNHRASKYGMPSKDEVTVIDADVMKEKIPEYQFDPETNTGTGTTDRNKAASFAHEESSALAKRAMQAAFENGYNCTLDGTGDGSAEGVIKKIKQARAAGYKVEGKYCTKDIESAIQANLARAERTGRLVQLDSVINIHKEVSKIFPQVAKEFDHVELWDHNGPEPVLIAECYYGQEVNPVNKELYDRFLAKKDYKG